MPDVLEVEDQMRSDDETTAHQLYSLLSRRGYSLSLRIILRCKTILGWTFRESAYCQLIHNANKDLIGCFVISMKQQLALKMLCGRMNVLFSSSVHHCIITKL